MSFLRTDDDYRALGLEPPKRSPTSVPGNDNEALAAQINAMGQHVHKWVQVGNFMECTAGQHPHGHPFDHVNNILVGTSPTGEPIFKTIELQKLDKKKASGHTKI